MAGEDVQGGPLTIVRVEDVLQQAFAQFMRDLGFHRLNWHCYPGLS